MTIVRSGSTRKYAENWSKVFGGKKRSTKRTTKATASKTAGKSNKKSGKRKASR